MEKIIAKLKAGNLYTEKVEKELASFWKYCVEPVSDPKLKNVVVHFLEEVTPLGFFVNPASSSGKHHPSWQVAEAGILRNTTECCLALNQQLRIYPEFTDERYNVLPEHRDIVLVATILSDTFKYGNKILASVGSESKLDHNHGQVAAYRWIAVAKKFKIPSETTVRIYTAIFWHLGRWTPGWTPGTKLDLYTEIVHRVDMLFADKNLEYLYTPKETIGA